AFAPRGANLSAGLPSAIELLANDDRHNKPATAPANSREFSFMGVLCWGRSTRNATWHVRHCVVIRGEADHSALPALYASSLIFITSEFWIVTSLPDLASLNMVAPSRCFTCVVK